MSKVKNILNDNLETLELEFEIFSYFLEAGKGAVVRFSDMIKTLDMSSTTLARYLAEYEMAKIVDRVLVQGKRGKTAGYVLTKKGFDYADMRSALLFERLEDLIDRMEKLSKNNPTFSILAEMFEKGKK